MNHNVIRILTISLLAAGVFGCSKSDPVEQALKDAEKAREQAQQMAAEAAKQAEDSMKQANELVGKSLEDAHAQMKALQNNPSNDPNVQAKLDEANKKVVDAQAKAAEAMKNAQNQLNEMSKQGSAGLPKTGK